MENENKNFKDKIKETLNLFRDEHAMDSYLNSIKPTGEVAKRNNLWMGACAATVATGLYTYMINWNPGIRALAHLGGAFALPAGGAFVSSIAMDGVEKIVNLGINSYNKKHPENIKEPFEIDPKVRNAIKLISSAVVGVAYTYGTLGTEVAQYQQSQIFQFEQYAADIGGSLAGIAAFHKMEFKDTLASVANTFWTAGKAITKPINAIEDKLKGKNKTNSEKTSSMQVEEISIDSEFNKTKNQPQQTVSMQTIDMSQKETLDIQESKSNPENEIEL